MHITHEFETRQAVEPQARWSGDSIAIALERFTILLDQDEAEALRDAIDAPLQAGGAEDTVTARFTIGGPDYDLDNPGRDLDVNAVADTLRAAADHIERGRTFAGLFSRSGLHVGSVIRR